MLNRTVKMKDRENGKVTVIYDATEVITRLQAPILKDEKVPKTIHLLIISFMDQLLSFYHL